MGAKVLNKPKYLFNFQKLKPIASAVGSAIISIYQTIKDPVTGVFSVVKAGEHNRQAEMDADARNVNLKSLLEQADAGKIKRVPGVYADTSKIPENMYDARKNANSVANLWNKDPLIRSMYATKDDYLLDITNGVDIENKIKVYRDKIIATSKKAFADFKKPNEKPNEKSNEKPIEKEKEVK